MRRKERYVLLGHSHGQEQLQPVVLSYVLLANMHEQVQVVPHIVIARDVIVETSFRGSVERVRVN